MVSGTWKAIKPLEVATATTAVTAAEFTPAEEAAIQAATITATEEEQEKAYSRIWFGCEEVNQIPIQNVSKGVDAWRIF